MNAEIKELYELIDNYGTPADSESTDSESADSESADSESADSESADSESADNEQMGSADPLTAGLEPRHETTIDDSPDRDHRASPPPRAPP